MKISVLVNDIALDGFKNEHGLSLFVDSFHNKILFDTGMSNLFFENAKKMNVDISQADACVISHGHFDHGGGLEFFIKKFPNKIIYLHQKAFGKYLSEKRYIGLNTELKNKPNFIFLPNGIKKINSEITIFSDVNQQKLLSESNLSLKMVKDGNVISDAFLHEQNMIIEEKGKFYLFTGCSHKGIVNIMNRAKEIIGNYPYAVIGGFHLSSPSKGTCEKEELVQKVAYFLLETGSLCYTLHCTGNRGYKILKGIMKNKLDYLPAGRFIEI